MDSEKPNGPGARARLLLLILPAVLLFFCVSGACGLLYQVVWTRKLVLLFGTTAYAVSTVLSIFFLGLGFGSLWGGRLADRNARPLRLYGIFELLIGAWAIVFILAVNLSESGVAGLLSLFQGSRGLGIVLRAIMAAGLLAVPVVLMGATLPLLAKFVDRAPKSRGFRVGALYTVNTFGAVTGCYLAGFYLIEHFGYTVTTLFGASANVFIGVLALLMSSRIEGASRDLEEPRAEAPVLAHTGEAPLARGQVMLILGAFAVSGFCALALEVLWTRLLAIVFLGTTYAYSAMLTTLLCGIALGGGAASLFVDRIRADSAALGRVLCATGVASLLVLPWIAGLPEQVQTLQQSTSNDWAGIVRGTFLLSFGVLFLPTFCFGMTFPIVVKALSGLHARLGRDMGVLYSANTFGGVLGAAAGGFLLLPLLGAHNSILLLSSLLFFCGLLLVAACPTSSIPLRALVALIALCAGGLAWSRAPEDVSLALNSGYIPEDHHVLFYREGIEGTVAVSEPVQETEGSNRVLWINRVQATASIERGVKMNRLQGALPLLFDRDPTEVLFMCFGSGVTCGTLAQGGFERIDAVEISPDVLRAAPLFAADNLGVIENPAVNFHIDDGRNYLLTTHNRYDVITFEPMPLALAGVSTFYTQEYYRLCFNRLKPKGIVSQWVPFHSLSPELVKSLVHTFTTVFPEYCAFFINADLFLIGSNAPLAIDYARAAERLESDTLREALADAGLRDTIEVVASFLLDKAGVDAFAQGGEAMSDDLPWAEFLAPRLVYAGNVPATLALAEPLVSSPLGTIVPGTASEEMLAAIERRHQARRHDLLGLQRYYGGMIAGTEVPDTFIASLEIDPSDYNAQYYLKQSVVPIASAMIRWEEFQEVEDLLSRSLRFLPEDPDLHRLLEELREAQKTAEEAAAQGQR